MIEQSKKRYYSSGDEYSALKRFVRLAREDANYNLATLIAQSIEDELTPRQTELLNMYYGDQKTMQTIADELSLSISSVSRTIRRGRETLKKYLKYTGHTFTDALDELRS